MLPCLMNSLANPSRGPSHSCSTRHLPHFPLIFQLFRAKYANFQPFLSNDFRTLSFSVGCKSFACHSYENCRVYTNSSHFETPRASSLTTNQLAFHHPIR